MMHPTCPNVVTDSQRSMICTSVRGTRDDFRAVQNSERGKVNSSQMTLPVKLIKLLFFSQFTDNRLIKKSHDVIIMDFGDLDPLFINNCSDRS